MSVDFEEDNNPFGHSTLGPSHMASPIPAAPAPSKLDDDDDLLINQDPRYSTMVLINPESRVSRLLKPGQPVAAEIIDAGNCSEGSTNSRSYVVYTIRITSDALPGEKAETRRRYLDFEGLREILCKIFPLVVTPPIPRKNFVNLKQLVPELSRPDEPNGDLPKYAYINSTHLNKRKLIEHRTRLLQRFLKNCLAIPQIRNLEFFSKFLDPNANWQDEMLLILTNLPKSVYLSNPENGLKTEAIYQNLPVPTSLLVKSIVKKGANLFTGDDESPERKSPEQQGALDTNGLDVVNKRIMDGLIGMAQDYSDLGTIFNSLSLTDGEDASKLHLVFDRIGQIFDRLYITIISLVSELETRFSEPLGEVVQFSLVAHDIEKFHTRKLKQKLFLENEVKDKRAELEHLLQAEGQPTTHAMAAKLRFSFKKLSQLVSDIIDQNPEQTRKQRIEYIKKKLEVLDKCLGIMLEDLSYIADELSKNFSAFKRSQLARVYEILLDYNRALIGWAKKNCEIWEEVRAELVEI